MVKINIISALSSYNNAIGNNGKLLWRIPDDLKRFKRLTMGHAIIMGRKTFESIGKPLPGRMNIVVTRNENYSADGCMVAHSLDDALLSAKRTENEDVFIIGGGEIYKQAIPYVDKLYLTLVDDRKDADVFFPDYSEFKKEVYREEREHEGLKYTWIDLERK